MGLYTIVGMIDVSALAWAQPVSEQVVELVSVVGYFGLLAMQLNTFHILPDPRDGKPPPELSLSVVSPNAGA